MSEPKFEIGQKVTLVYGDVAHETVLVEHRELRRGTWFYMSGGHEFAEGAAREWRQDDDAPVQRTRDMHAIEFCAGNHLWDRLTDESIHEIASIIRRSEGEEEET